MYNQNEPTEILPNHLYLGNYSVSRDQAKLQSLNIKYIVNAAKEIESQFLNDIIYSQDTQIEDRSDENIESKFSSVWEIFEKARVENVGIFIATFYSQAFFAIARLVSVDPQHMSFPI
jgi:hypothetical protein